MDRNFLNAENRYLSPDVPNLYFTINEMRLSKEYKKELLQNIKNGGERFGKRVKRKAN